MSKPRILVCAHAENENLPPELAQLTENVSKSSNWTEKRVYEGGERQMSTFPLGFANRSYLLRAE